MRDVGWQQGDLRLRQPVLTVIEVVPDRALVDDQHGPGVVRVTRVRVGREVRVQDLDDTAQLGPPRSDLRVAAHASEHTLLDVKIYISVDMEGITGLVDAEDVQPPGRDYERGRILMTEDTNAAVRGAYDAGATAVLVNDAHGPMRNLLPDLLDPRATLIKGRPKPMGMMEGLTS
jgi:hypothetical protein